MEIKKEKSCGAIVYNDNNEVLIIRHNEGHWDFPKGHVEVGESELDTATREVKEETNIDVKLYTEYRYEIHYEPKENVKKTVVFFLARNISNDLSKQDSEIQDIGWYDYSSALNILTYNDAKNLLKKSFEDLKNI